MKGFGYLKTHRVETLRVLKEKFGHSPTFAGKTLDDYLIYMDEELTVDFKHLEKLLSQVARRHRAAPDKWRQSGSCPGVLRGSMWLKPRAAWRLPPKAVSCYISTRRHVVM